MLAFHAIKKTLNDKRRQRRTQQRRETQVKFRTFLSSLTKSLNPSPEDPTAVIGTEEK